jgi:hypothetical protein
MNELITIRTFSSSVDCEMVKAYLMSFGIECYVKDEFVNRAYLANVNGGVKLLVKQEQLNEAIDILIEGGYLTKEDLEPTNEMKWIEKFLSRLL